ncbi:MAG: hypothetical protein ACK55Z_33655 [bacterium]
MLAALHRPPAPGAARAEAVADGHAGPCPELEACVAPDAARVGVLANR